MKALSSASSEHRASPLEQASREKIWRADQRAALVELREHGLIEAAIFPPDLAQHRGKIRLVPSPVFPFSPFAEGTAKNQKRSVMVPLTHVWSRGSIGIALRESGLRPGIFPVSCRGLRTQEYEAFLRDRYEKRLMILSGVMAQVEKQEPWYLGLKYAEAEETDHRSRSVGYELHFYRKQTLEFLSKQTRCVFLFASNDPRLIRSSRYRVQET